MYYSGWREINMSAIAETALLESIGHITGLREGSTPLGGRKVENGGSQTQHVISDFFKTVLLKTKTHSPNPLIPVFNEVKKAFIDTYSRENKTFLKERLSVLRTAKDPDARAKAAAEIWAPEIAMPDETILAKWQLSGVTANPRPYLPDEVVLQVNALYSLPQAIPAHLPDSVQKAWNQAQGGDDETVFDYDHPVPLFCRGEGHELLACLKELDNDIGFEKSRGVFKSDYRVPVVVSISVTHPRIAQVCDLWLRHVMAEKAFHHLGLYILTEQAAQTIKKAIGFFPAEPAVFSVPGSYANHFNALKYFQLILEKTDGIRAGFKIDSDEGIRSRDLFEATGKTWFQTLCHEYWGGAAVDEQGAPVYLGIIAGEYINEKDIRAHGYENCLRMPDVTFDGNYIGPDIFFKKGVAHARATDLYNRKGTQLEDFISHPVVKGGGFGIDNAALRRFIPFTYSRVGRAEDQQFYMAGMARGNRSIFTPDLRIAHYKQRVAASESATEATRFLGDMFRLVIFNEIVDLLGLKSRVDPMPGVFAGPLARIQAFFSIVYKSYGYFAQGDAEMGEQIYHRGLTELKQLTGEIDTGKIRSGWRKEQADWEDFVHAVDRASRAQLARAVRDMAAGAGISV